jgi:L-asparaginase
VIKAFFLGGTISLTSHAAGVVPRLGPDELLASVPDASAFGEVVAVDFRRMPSADLTPADVAAVVAAAEGADGVVVVQGTDTIEETAFLLDLLWASAGPVVVTGAMRDPTLPGADGPANLTAALIVASSSAFQGQGALVVLDDQVHAARYVTKAHTSSTAAFVSADAGALGRVVEGRVLRYTSVRRLAPLPVPPQWDVRVPVYVATLGDDGAMLEHVRADALVVAGVGGGHVPGRLAQRLGALAEQMPVVLTSRTGAGPVLTRTYGAPGGEIDLIGRGLIPAGTLSPYKARLLALVGVANGWDRAKVAAAFAAYG